MSQKSLWAKFPRAIYAFLLGLLDGKAASFTEYTLQIWLSKWAPQYQTNSIGHQGTFGKHHKSTMLHSGPKKCKNKQIHSRYHMLLKNYRIWKQFEQMSFLKNYLCFVQDFVHFLSLNLEQCVKKEKKKEKKMAFFIYICVLLQCYPPAQKNMEQTLAE